jgi:hypothetical protein
MDSESNLHPVDLVLSQQQVHSVLSQLLAALEEDS